MRVPALLSNFSQNNLIRQRHPYSFYHGPNPLALIVGTAPPQRFCKFHNNLKMNSITANDWRRKEPPFKKMTKIGIMEALLTHFGVLCSRFLNAIRM